MTASIPDITAPAVFFITVSYIHRAERIPFGCHSGAMEDAGMANSAGLINPDHQTRAVTLER